MLLPSVRKIPYLLLSLLSILCFAHISHASYFQPDEAEAQIREAAGFISSGKHVEAETSLLQLIERSSPDAKAFLLLGRLYLIKGETVKAEQYLKKAEEEYPLLKDYASKLLADTYLKSREYEKALDAAAQIKNSLLKKEVMLIRIKSLLVLKRDNDAKKELYEFINLYPQEWDYKWMLASLLRGRGETEAAVKIYKDIYISASPLSTDASKELKPLKADIFTKREILKRADNFFKKGDYRLAEVNYNHALKGFIDPIKKRIKYQIATCRFRLKDYDKSAAIFGTVGSARAKYWQARSLYRADRFGEFVQVVNELRKKYPNDKYSAMALFVYADDFRRKGDVNAATEIFNKIIENSPSDAEEALWGIAWMNYTAGNYEAALAGFIRLSEYKKSKDYNKYIYWKARSIDKLSENCLTHKSEGVNCPASGKYLIKDFAPDNSYYGLLLRLNYGIGEMPERAAPYIPERPEGVSFQRIDALALLGMKDEAVNEIAAVLSKSLANSELLYLGYLAKSIDEYKSIIRFAEGAEGRDFLVLSYPLAYWDIISSVSESKGIDPYLVEALIREESRFNSGVMSWAGAYGLMQLMPATAGRLKSDAGVVLKNESDLYDVEKNILIGTHYLSLLLKEFKVLPFSIASYNAGENAVRGWMKRYQGRPSDEIIEEIPYDETRNYVKKVLRSYWRYRLLYGLNIEGY
ncbi:MAG: transglycosylase SLT domain-containing protein [Thermodesulfovibrionia bacterium]|nr:transglycosylase SLT domain-containing protein [Thermodesulfovibrionia bacterium]